MSGLVKAKKYDWRDSNLAMFGSDTEKEVKKESAMSEPAWEGAGAEEGLQIWRIVKFEVTHWPKEDYGKFFSGDSYIVLNTYKANPDSDALSYDVHFWIGSRSTQDEYGTVAYKTVELDTFLDDKAVQHREVMGHESDMFLSYFKALQLMEGGADSGFRHVEPEQYTPRLLHFSGKMNKVVVKEIPRNRARVSSGDVYILDLGTKLYQFNGSSCSIGEKAKAMQFVQELEGERNGRAETEVLDEFGLSDEHPFYAALTEDDEDDDDVTDDPGDDQLFKVSDAQGDMSMSKVKEGQASLEDFASSDVFLLDTGKTCFVWVGKDASPGEKKNGMAYAQNHLKASTHPLVSIVVVSEGQHCKEFTAAVAA